jgi:integrase
MGFKSRSEGHETWKWEDIQNFAARHPPGTKAHRALALLLFTGQRRGDVVRVGRQHIKDGALEFVQQKGGKEMRIPILPALKEALDAVPDAQLIFW